MPHEHVENAGTRKRRTLWIELPLIDPLENEIGALQTQKEKGELSTEVMLI